MNYIIISHNSAFNIYRSYRSKNNIKLSTCDIHLTNFCIKQNLKEIKNFLNQWMPTDIALKDFMFTEKNSSHHTADISFHYFKGKLPNKSLLKIRENIYVVCPELMFCQMASILSIEKLMLLGLEICGNYTVLPNPDSSLSTNIRPLTSTEKIQDYVLKFIKYNPGFKGCRKVLDVIKFLKNNSASPLESRLYTILCFPRKYGGYGLKNAVLNKEISLSKHASKIVRQKIIKPDICVQKKKIAIEYDSDQFHDNSFQNRKDKLRLDALTYDGWKVFSFVTGQLNNIESLDKMAMMILKANGQSTRNRMKDFYSRRNKLVLSLMK